MRAATVRARRLERDSPGVRQHGCGLDVGSTHSSRMPLVLRTKCALGSGYATGVSSSDLDRINRSAIHLDFMIGSDDVAVTGRTRDGRDVPLLRGGAWQV